MLNETTLRIEMSPIATMGQPVKARYPVAECTFRREHRVIVKDEIGHNWLLDSLNPMAGVRELKWLSENLHLLQNYRNQWIGVFGEEIVASGTSFDKVYEQAAARGLADVLIEYIPDEPSKWDRLIA